MRRLDSGWSATDSQSPVDAVGGSVMQPIWSRRQPGAVHYCSDFEGLMTWSSIWMLARFNLRQKAAICEAMSAIAYCRNAAVCTGDENSKHDRFILEDDNSRAAGLTGVPQGRLSDTGECFGFRWRFRSSCVLRTASVNISRSSALVLGGCRVLDFCQFAIHPIWGCAGQMPPFASGRCRQD
jgi:hypothetical protein